MLKLFDNARIPSSNRSLLHMAKVRAGRKKAVVKEYSLEEDVAFVIEIGEKVLRQVFGGTWTNNKIASEMKKPQSMISGYSNRLVRIGLLYKVTDEEEKKRLFRLYKYRIRSSFEPYQLTAHGKDILKVFDSYRGEEKTRRTASILLPLRPQKIDENERNRIEALVKEARSQIGDDVRIMDSLNALIRAVYLASNNKRNYWASLDSVEKLPEELLDGLTSDRSKILGLRFVRAYIIASNIRKAWIYRDNNLFNKINKIAKELDNASAFEACLTLIAFRNPDTAIANDLLKAVLDIIWTIFRPDYGGPLISTQIEVEMLNDLWNDLSMDQKNCISRVERYMSANTFDMYVKAVRSGIPPKETRQVDVERLRPLRQFLLSKLI